MNMLLENNETLGQYSVLPIPVDDLTLLMKSELFESINDKFYVFIDNYEEEEIVGASKLSELKNTIEKFQPGDAILSYYKELIIGMVDLAIKFDTGVFFYF